MKGSVKKRGNSWYYTVDLPRDEMGQRKQKKKGGFKTKKEAEAALAQVITEVERGEYIQSANMTFGELLERWIEYKIPLVRKSTLNNYSGVVKNHLKPKLGKISLDKLTALHIQRLYTSLLTREVSPISPSFLRGIHLVVHDSLNCAVKWGIIIKNVSNNVELPKEKKKQVDTWTFEEAAAFLEYAKEVDKLLYLPALLSLTTGLRAGEVIALRWQDINFEKGLLSVRQTTSRDGGKYRIEPTKTTAGMRAIALPKQTSDALKSHKIEQNKRRLSSGFKYHNEEDYVFTNEHGERINNKTMRRHWRSTVDKSGLKPIRFHDLRHTHASLLLLQGVHPKVVSERLGHSTIGITMNTYSHVLPGIQEEAANQFGNELFGHKEKRGNSM